MYMLMYVLHAYGLAFCHFAIEIRYVSLLHSHFFRSLFVAHTDNRKRQKSNEYRTDMAQCAIVRMENKSAHSYLLARKTACARSRAKGWE